MEIRQMILITKLNKDSTKPQNYSLFSALGYKIFERIIDNRTKTHLKQNNHFSPFQSGFRLHRSTINQRITNHN